PRHSTIARWRSWRGRCAKTIPKWPDPSTTWPSYTRRKVLSACNTAAGDKPGAEALSGLARAFFYAGARALLVSHWSVDSQAATRITTSTFDNMKRDAKIGRSEALRRAMLAYMDDKSDPWSAYPGFWGAFS